MDSTPSPRQADPPDVAIGAIKEAYRQGGHTAQPPPRLETAGLKAHQDDARHPELSDKRLALAASPGRAQLRHAMASDLAAVEQEIEQLKGSIEQLKARQEQMVRDNAELAAQLRAAQAQMARDSEDAAERLKASQEQTAGLI